MITRSGKWINSANNILAYSRAWTVSRIISKKKKKWVGLLLLYIFLKYLWFSLLTRGGWFGNLKWKIEKTDHELNKDRRRRWFDDHHLRSHSHKLDVLLRRWIESLDWEVILSVVRGVRWEDRTEISLVWEEDDHQNPWNGLWSVE